MGSSYSSDLRNGSMKEWEDKLRPAIALIEEVVAEVYDCIGSDGQYDNAGEDGALAERLSIAVQLISDTLPPKKEG